MTSQDRIKLNKLKQIGGGRNVAKNNNLAKVKKQIKEADLYNDFNELHSYVQGED